MEYALFSEKGQRKQNADYAIADPENNIFVIADGVGSNFFAKHASREACKTAHKNFLESKIKNSMQRLLYSLVDAHNSLILNAINGETTIDFVYIKNNKAYMGHAGDSRVYLLRKGNLKQLTEDQVAGKYIISAVGFDIFEPEQKEIEIKKRDMIAMTTDGVHNILSREELADLLAKGISLEDTAELLKLTVQYKGALDNYTGILIRV